MGFKGGTKSAIVSVDLLKGVEGLSVKELSVARCELSSNFVLVVCLTSFGPRGDTLFECAGSSWVSEKS